MKKTKIILLVYIMMSVLFISVAYSSFNTNLYINGVGVIRAQADVRINGITNIQYVDEAIENFNPNYNIDRLNVSVNLPTEESSISYNVLIKNYSDAVYISSIELESEVNENVVIEFSDGNDIYNIPNDDMPFSLSSNEQKNYTLTISNKNGTTNNNVIVSLKFNYIYDIVTAPIIELSNNNDYVELLSIGTSTFGVDYYEYYVSEVNTTPSDIMQATGHVSSSLNLNSFNYSKYYVWFRTVSVKGTRSSWSNVVTIEQNAIVLNDAYFMEYNGENSLLGYDKTTIKNFSRSNSLTTTYTYTEVQNDVSGDYKSNYKVYAWLEPKGDLYDLKWYSEADTVLFHPDTMNAFRGCINMVTIDLTGTSTQYVKNFSSWFNGDVELTTLTGKISTNGLALPENDTINYGAEVLDDQNVLHNHGLAFMFNDCNKLTNIDVSEFNTTNAVSMKRMFAGCKALKSLDLSHFDTSNVKSMFWMFRNNHALKSLDLSSFDTRNVENMIGMFISCKKITTLTLGDNFITDKVTRMDYMFNGMTNLITIFAKRNFDLDSLVSSSSMFTNCVNLVGDDNTYTFPYSASYTNARYAKIAKEGPPVVQGYFTEVEEEQQFYITYDLDGGSTDNPLTYTSSSGDITLNNPTKANCVFLGWIGSNGSTPQKNVTIPSGSIGNRSYTAIFTHPANDPNMELVFNIPGSCVFDGNVSNISTTQGSTCRDTVSNTDYVNSGKYIDTGIMLYDDNNYMKDYEIYIEVTSFDPDNQDSGTQQTIMNSKNENGTMTAPGIVFRRSGSKLEIKQSVNSDTGQFISNATVNNIRIYRIKGIVFFSINGGDITFLQNMSSMLPAERFSKTVWFGASYNENYVPQRHVRATISNISIKLAND